MTDNGEIPTPIEEAPSAAPSNPRVLGYLAPPKIKLMQSLRQAGRDVVQEIGMLEVRKARLLSNLADVEARAESIMAEEGKRVGIPEGTAFQVTPEGAILVMNQLELPNTPSAEG